MKIILLSIIASATVIGTSLAQGGPGGRQFDPERLVAAEKNLLLDSIAGLNEDQKLIITAIYEDYSAALNSARKDMNPDNREAMRAKKTKIRDEKNQALKEILTAKQMTAFEELLARRRAQRRQRSQRRNE